MYVLWSYVRGASPTVVGKVWLSRRLFIELLPLSNRPLWSLSSSLFNRPHFCLQFSAPIDSPRPVFPPPPVERNTLDPSRETRKYSVLLEKSPQQQCSANLATCPGQALSKVLRAAGRPLQSAPRSTDLDELPVRCHRLLLGIGTIMRPAGRPTTTGPAAAAAAAAIRSDSDSTTLHSTPPQDTARLGWWVSGYAIFLAAFYSRFSFVSYP